MLIRPTAPSWKQRASKTFTNFWQNNLLVKYISGHQEEKKEEEGYEEVSDFEEEFEDDNDMNVDRRERGNKKERKKIFFEK